MDDTIRQYHHFIYRFCLLFFIPFLLYVAGGYFYGVGSGFPDLPTLARLVLATAAALLVFFLVIHSAGAFHSAFRLGDGSRLTWAVWYIALFCVSGVGFVIMSLLMFEGPTVLREAIDEAVPTITALQQAADKFLPVQDYEDAKSRITALKTELHREIVNPALCGVGPSATKTIERIQEILPDFSKLNGSDRSINCAIPAQKAIVDGIADSYDAKVDAGMSGLINTAKYSRLNTAGRYRLRDEIRTAFQSDLDRLGKTRDSLVGIWTLFGRMETYRRAVTELETAATHYASERRNLLAFLGADQLANLPQGLDVSSVEKIASPVSLVPNLIARSGTGTTWVYLALALLMDFLAVYVWSVSILGPVRI